MQRVPCTVPVLWSFCYHVGRYVAQKQSHRRIGFPAHKMDGNNNPKKTDCHTHQQLPEENDSERRHYFCKIIIILLERSAAQNSFWWRKLCFCAIFMHLEQSNRSLKKLTVRVHKIPILCTKHARAFYEYRGRTKGAWGHSSRCSVLVQYVHVLATDVHCMTVMMLRLQHHCEGKAHILSTEKRCEKRKALHHQRWRVMVTDARTVSLSSNIRHSPSPEEVAVSRTYLYCIATVMEWEMRCVRTVLCLVLCRAAYEWANGGINVWHFYLYNNIIIYSSHLLLTKKPLSWWYSTGTQSVYRKITSWSILPTDKSDPEMYREPYRSASERQRVVIPALHSESRLGTIQYQMLLFHN